MSLEITPRNRKLPAYLPESTDYTSPGKVFLAGEYLVLVGGPAVVAAIGPRFGWERSPDCGQPEAGQLLSDRTLSPGAPAYRLRAWFEQMGHGPRARDLGAFYDPLRGAGGIGASTAEFALLARAWGAERLPGGQDSVALYRALLGGGRSRGDRHAPPPPSGADLAAQIQGGVIHAQLGSDGTLKSKPCALSTRTLPIAVFSTTVEAPKRKVATHAHLAGFTLAALEDRLSGTAGQRLERASLDVYEALGREDWELLGDAFERYGNELRSIGLEHAPTQELRDTLRRAPGVLGVKGSGALQADLLVVVFDPSHAGAAQALSEHARELGLYALQNGIRSDEPGLRFHEVL